MELNNVKEIMKNGIVATATVVLDDEVYINDIAVLEGQHGLFFEMPGQRYQDANGEWKTNYYALPVNKDASNRILHLVKEAVDAGYMREVHFDKRPALKGFVNIKTKDVSIKVTYTNKGHVLTPSQSYEKDGETKYFNYIGIDGKQAKEIAKLFEEKFNY